MAVFVLVDVTALYTSIPHGEAYRVVSKVLDRRTKKEPPSFFLLVLLEIILEKNRFDDSYYMQIKGVSMRYAAVPSIVNLFMEDLETATITN